MNQSLIGLLEGVRRSLRDDVQAELTSDHARTQLAGVLDILGKLERLVVWSPDALRERLDVIEAGCASIALRAVSSGHPPPPHALPALPALMRQADLEQALRRAEQRLAALSDWLFDPAAELPPALRRELDSALRATLRSALVVERRLVQRADFSSMTGAVARAGTDPSTEHRT